MSFESSQPQLVWDTPRAVPGGCCPPPGAVPAVSRGSRSRSHCGARRWMPKGAEIRGGTVPGIVWLFKASSGTKGIRGAAWGRQSSPPGGGSAHSPPRYGTGPGCWGWVLCWGSYRRAGATAVVIFWGADDVPTASRSLSARGWVLGRGSALELGSPGFGGGGQD